MKRKAAAFVQFVTSVKKLIQPIKRTALTFVQFGAWVMTLFGGFYSNIAPPDDSLKFWPSYASMLAGLGFIVYRKLGQKSRTIIVSIAIALAAALPVVYFWRYQNLTGQYTSYRVICGTELTRHAAQYVSSHPDRSSKENLIFDFSGKTTDIWTEASINRARLTLGLSYSVGFGFLSLAILSAIEESKGSPSQMPGTTTSLLKRRSQHRSPDNQVESKIGEKPSSRKKRRQ